MPCLSNPISWRGTYARAYDEVKALGGDGTHTPTVRTADQTYIGIYWAYDGTPSLCALPRSFSSLSQAEEENGQSRIYLGIH